MEGGRGAPGRNNIPNSMIDRHWSGSIRRSREIELDINGDRRVRGVVYMTKKVLRDHFDSTVRFFCRAFYFPIHFRRVLRRSPVDFPIKILNDLRTALCPPVLGASSPSCHFSSVRGSRQRRNRIGLRFVVVRGVLRLRIAPVCSPSKRSLDPQEFHSPGMVLLGGELDRRREFAARRL